MAIDNCLTEFDQGIEGGLREAPLTAHVVLKYGPEYSSKPVS